MKSPRTRIRHGKWITCLAAFWPHDGDFETTASSLTQIAGTMEDFAETNRQVNRHVSEIHGLGQLVTERLNHTEHVADELSGVAEQVQEMVSRFIIGEGEFDRTISLARKQRDVLQGILQQQLKAGVDVLTSATSRSPAASRRNTTPPMTKSWPAWCNPITTPGARCRWAGVSACWWMAMAMP
jgi:hypothetical protein